MHRDQLAIHGTEGRDGTPRVEIVLNADGQPDLLHPADGGGRFARVIRGFVGAGHLPKAIAIKLERDEVDPAAGAVKFISEYQAQIRVHERLKDGEQSRVVRLFEMWKLPAHLTCDELAPTILCPHSRQVLAPRCPNAECGAELRDDRTCPQGCPAAPKEAILAASRCADCVKRGATCPAYWLNARTCKILLLELLDIDLEQYLHWRWSAPTPPPRDRPAWKKYSQEHLPAIAERDSKLGRRSDPLMTQFDEWRFVLDLFKDLLDGVRELHACRTAHLDLKPANLCLTLEGATARLKIIDLGQADNPDLPWSVRLHSINDDADARRASGAIFWAPEQMPSRFVQTDVMWRRDGKKVQLLVNTEAPAARKIIEGDVFCFPTTDEQNPFLRITNVTTAAQGLEVSAISATAAPLLPALPENWTPLPGGCFVQTAGACADLFALGLLLVHLIGRGRIDLTPLRSRVDELTRWLRAHGDQAASLPTRALVEGIGKIESPEIAAIWNRLLGDLPENVPLRELVKELLGAALQAFVRGVPGFSYAQHRGHEMTKATGLTPLERFRADLLAIRNRLVTLAQTYDLHDGRVARFRRAGLTQCLAWLKKQPSADPAGKPPEYDRARISCALDLLASDPFHNAREFRFLLRYYRGVARWMRKDLVLFSKELKARLTMAQMHPVVLAMFEVVSPPARSRNGKKPTTALETINNPVIKARHVILRCKKQLQDQLDELRQALALVTRGRRWYATEADVARFGDRVDLITGITSELHEHANRLRDWHQELQTSQKQKIFGWERLELGGAGSWHEFGKRVIQDFADKRRAAVQWHRKLDSAAEMACGVADEIRSDLLTAWPGLQSRYRGSFAGLCRRFLAWLRGRPLSVPLRDARKWVAEWLVAIEAAEERIAKIGPPPFDALLHQNLVLPPKRKADE